MGILKQKMIGWVRKHTARVPGLDVKNMGSDFADGRVFRAILYRVGDGIAKKEAFEPSNDPAENLAVAFEEAKLKYGVPKLLVTEEPNFWKDEKAMIPQLAEFMRRLPDVTVLDDVYDKKQAALKAAQEEAIALLAARAKEALRLQAEAEAAEMKRKEEAAAAERALAEKLAREEAERLFRAQNWNKAVVCIRPHACTDAVKAMVTETLKGRGVNVLSEAPVAPETIDGNRTDQWQHEDHHYVYEVEFDPDALSWVDFRASVLGPKDKADDEEEDPQSRESLCGLTRSRWQELGLKAEPAIRDNNGVIHASASPFEALCERLNWLSADISADSFASVLMEKGVTQETIADWTKNPMVPDPSSKGTTGSSRRRNTKPLFDILEDKDTPTCIYACQGISRLIRFTKAVTGFQGQSTPAEADIAGGLLNVVPADQLDDTEALKARIAELEAASALLLDKYTIMSSTWVPPPVEASVATGCAVDVVMNNTSNVEASVATEAGGDARIRLAEVTWGSSAGDDVVTTHSSDEISVISSGLSDDDSTDG
uniref:Calponin-homology (CH) domain-containing protein n=1 Tax=Octactis speculum TaxID=3111310 RepID=A0A7S2MCF2_9STRA